MELMQNGLAVFLVVFGIFFLLTGSVALVRLPDFFTRTHAISKADMLGLVLVLLGVAVYEGLTQNAVKLLIAVAFLGFATPIGAHALVKAAVRKGLRPWTREHPAEGEGEES